MLGKSLAEVNRLSAAEYAIWIAWAERRGFPADRIIGTAAKGLAYVGATWGGKAKPEELLPKFGEAIREDRAAVSAWFRARSKKRKGES